MPEAESMESALQESRRFAPPAEFASQAHIGSIEEYEKQHARSIAEPEAFWAEVASELHWFKPWDSVLEWNLPDAKWFVGGQDQPLLQLRRPAGRSGRPGRQRPPSSGRLSPWSRAARLRSCKLSYSDLQTRDQQVRQRAQVPGRSRRATWSPSTCPWCPNSPSPCSPAPASAPPHSIIFGGFSASSHSSTASKTPSSKTAHHLPTARWRRGKDRPAQRHRQRSA